MKTARVLVAVGLFLGAMVGLPGCGTSNYIPDADAANPKLVPDVPAGTKIALINGQPATELVEIGKSVTVSLHAWTDQAIESIARTLKKKGVVVDGQSPKSLKIAITKAVLSSAGSGWAFRCTVDFTVEMSDGKKVSLVADDTSWKYLNACDGVMSKMAIVALKDERVASFLRAR